MSFAVSTATAWPASAGFAQRNGREWRTAGLSDHAALEVDFAPESKLRMDRS